MVEINPLDSLSSSSCSSAAEVDCTHHHEESGQGGNIITTTRCTLPRDIAVADADATFPSSSSSPLLFRLSKSSTLDGEKQNEVSSHLNSTRPTTHQVPSSGIRKSNTTLDILHHRGHHQEQQLQQEYQSDHGDRTSPWIHTFARYSSSPSNVGATEIVPSSTATADPTASKSVNCSSTSSGQDLDRTTSQLLSSHQKPRVNSSYSISPLPTVAFTNPSTGNPSNLSLVAPHVLNRHHHQQQQQQEQQHFENPPISSIADPVALNNPIMNNFQSDFHFLNDRTGFIFPDYSTTMQQPSVNMMSSLEQCLVPTDVQKTTASTTPSSSLLLEESDSVVSQIMPKGYNDLNCNAPSPSPFNMALIHDDGGNGVVVVDDGDHDDGGRKSRKDFQYRLEEIRKFQKKHGHSMIPHKYPMNPSLGTWVDTQRRRYRKLVQCKKKFYQENPQGTDWELEDYIQSTGPHISQEHIDRLLEVGFVFEPRLSRNDTWEKRVEELKRYKELQGHCNVREDDVGFPGLGKWVSYVRRIYRLAKNKKMSSKGKRLSDDRIDELRRMGFIFEFKEEMAMKRFKEGLQTLKEFKLREGHCRVPSFYVDNPTFGLCVEDMRREYRMICNSIANGRDGFTDVMSHEIVQELANIGFLSEEGVTPYPTNTEPCLNATCSSSTNDL
jgi:hypothetical protein